MSFWRELQQMIDQRDIDRPVAREMAREIVARHPGRFTDLHGIPAREFAPMAVAARERGDLQECQRYTCWVMVNFADRRVVSYGSNARGAPPQAFIEALQDLELDPARS